MHLFGLCLYLINTHGSSNSMQDYFKYSNMDRNIIWGYECYSMLFDAFHNNHRVSMTDTAYLCTSVIFNPESLTSVGCMQAILSRLPSN